MINIKKYIQYALLTVVATMSFAVATPMASTAVAACPERAFFTFPVWYKGLTVDDNCNISEFKLNDVWIIVMNGVEILIQVVAYVASGFVLWGGFKYIKSEGDPGKISEAKEAILQAVIGLVIALASVAIVEFIQARIIQS